MLFPATSQSISAPCQANKHTLLDWAKRHTRWLVITGAGCSTQAGIPAYRDREGQWMRAQPVTYQAFMGNVLVRKRYWARSMLGWPNIAQAQPTQAHLALAQLQRMERIELLVTQNVDGLHTAAGSQQCIDLHGRLDTVRCMHCEERLHRQIWQNQLVQANPAWQGLEAHSLPDGDADVEDLPFEQFVIPACPVCASTLLKPDVVFFGESVPRDRVNLILQTIPKVDGVMVLGSSLMVYSGFRFVEAAAKQGVPIVAVNDGTTRADHLLEFKVQAEVGEVMQYLVQALTVSSAQEST